MKTAAILAILIELGLAAAAFAASQPPAANAQAVEFFEARVRPILADNCFSCHGEEKQKGGLRLDSRASALQGGDDGPVLVIGNPDKSVLIHAVRRDGKLKMPPRRKLPPAAVATLTSWVKMGAPWPETKGAVTSRAAAWKKHWAFQPVRKPALPVVKNPAWIASPVDAFILARLEGKSLTPARPADRRTLIRRASFDLTGLPPTPEEIAAFEADPAPDAFAKVVDRLLASPHYGERWGRYWLDVARYADTKGYVFDQERPFPCSHSYRDYVIRAFNEDLPYDQFVLQQLAADRLPLGNDRQPLAAMGYLTVGNRFMNNPYDIIDDRIDVVTRGLLGLTVTCARCHDHKFDPIPTKDYYSLYGVFASSVEPRALPVLAPPERSAAYLAYEKELHRREKKLDDFLKVKHTELTAVFRARAADYLLAVGEWQHQPSTENFMFVVQAMELNPRMMQRWRQFLTQRSKHDPVFAPWFALAEVPEKEFAAKAPALAAQWAANADPNRRINPLVARALAGKPPDSLKEIAQRYGRLFADVDAARKTASRLSPDQEQLLHVLYGPKAPPDVPLSETYHFMLDRVSRQRFQKLLKNVEHYTGTSPVAPPRAMVLQDAATPFDPHVFLRGKPERPGAEVPRQFLQVLAGPKRRPFQHGSGRLELAQAIVRNDNRLTARVMVNRIWLHHFGDGLVRTPSDFGMRSDPPTHPELLDYLAWRFVHDGWSVKKLHRLIMLSSVYQQACDGEPMNGQADPENRLLWKMNRQRLDFEGLRDALLAVSGKLNLKTGGQSVELTARPFSHRRTVYGFIDRSNVPGLFRTFDFPSPDTTSPQRYQTTVPLQALFLMNSPFVVEQARSLVNRPEVAKQPLEEAKIQTLYRLLYGRPADAEEVALGLGFVRGQPGHALTGWEKYAQVLLLGNEFVFID
ncbi:MAG TPA: PSD1 and planctomycete cytochrome C domain-containing protein [Gemmataceae bacterium]|nr:PSD1 and planctomycete cytochrome C domain-containing protein [Gemmataceae bacterium]